MEYNISCCKDYFFSISNFDTAVDMWCEVSGLFLSGNIGSKYISCLPSSIVRDRYNISFHFAGAINIFSHVYDTINLFCPEAFLMEGAVLC